MLLLTCLITTWLEHLQANSSSSSAKSYADDIFLWAKSKNKSDLCRSIRSLHDVTSSFVASCGMTLNHSKCFTFGRKSASDCIPAIQSHRSQFRLVGGSVKLDNINSLGRNSKKLESISGRPTSLTFEHCQLVGLPK